MDAGRGRIEIGRSVPRMLWPYAGAVVLAVVVQAALPRLAGRYDLYYTQIALDVGIAMMLAVSLNIVNGWTGQFSIGHAGFMALGGYAAGMVTLYGSLLLWGEAAAPGRAIGAGSWLFVAGCLLGGLLSAAAGYLVGLPSLRLRGDYLAIVTLGFGEIVRVLMQQTGRVIDDAESLRAAGWSVLAPPAVGGSTGFYGLPKYANLFWVYLFLAITVAIAYRIKSSSLGRAMIAVREDEIAAQAMGVNVARVKVLAFVLAAFFAGVAGGLYAHQNGVVLMPRDAGFQKSFDYLIMVVLGGQGSISGVMLAAAIVMALPEALREFEQYRLIVFALLLVVMMVVRPQGLFGSLEIWEYGPRWRAAFSRRKPA